MSRRAGPSQPALGSPSEQGGVPVRVQAGTTMDIIDISKGKKLLKLCYIRVSGSLPLTSNTSLGT